MAWATATGSLLLDWSAKRQGNTAPSQPVLEKRDKLISEKERQFVADAFVYTADAFVYTADAFVYTASITW